MVQSRPEGKGKEKQGLALVHRIWQCKDHQTDVISSSARECQMHEAFGMFRDSQDEAENTKESYSRVIPQPSEHSSKISPSI